MRAPWPKIGDVAGPCRRPAAPGVSLRRRSAGVALILAVLGCLPLRAADETPLLGPLRIRDMTPFSILRLDLPPGPDMSALSRGWAFEINYAHANTFVMSDNVRHYLEQRGRRAPLSEADVQAILALPGDAHYFDGAIGLLDFTVHYAFSDHWSAFANLPLHYYRGGFLDSTIEAFHRRFGFGTAGRNLVARNRLQMVMKIDGESFTLLRVPKQLGLADPVLGGRYFVSLPRRWGLVAEAAVKLPLGSTEDYFSSGSADLGVQLTAQRKFDHQAFYLGASWIRLGGTDILPGVTASGVPTATAAYEHTITERTSFLVQMTASRPVLESATDPQLTENKYQVSGGIRHRHGQRIYTFALTENVGNFNNTPDFGFHFGLARLFPRRR